MHACMRLAPHLQARQNGHQFVIWQRAEVGALHGQAVSEDTALTRNVLCCVNIVASHHANVDAGCLASLHRLQHFSPQRVLINITKYTKW